MPNLLERLKERKLVQWAVTSAAVGWVAVQVLDVVADPWGLSNGVVRGAQAALVVGFVVVLVLAWYHGEQGRQRVSGPELLIIGGLGVVSGLLYVSISAPGDSVMHEPTTAITADGTPAEEALVPLPSGPTVAVLPFTNMSGDPEQEFFSDGLSEDIITKLSRFKDLLVIARNSTFQYKGKAVDVRDVARELGARYVLEGSVRKAGTSLRVTAQLLDASDGTHLWAETYDRDLSASSIFAVQDEITEQVVGTIAGSGVISRARFAVVERKPPESLAGYECVLLAQNSGRYDTIRSEYRKKARSCLERTVRDDPGYTDAWAWLAMIDLHEYMYNPDPSSEVLELALRSAQRAVETDPSHQFAIFALAHVHFFQHELARAFAGFDRAVALNPNNVLVVSSAAGNFIFAGEGERGIALSRRAAAMDPQHPLWLHHNVAAYHFQREEYAEALAAARHATQQGNFWTYLYISASYSHLDRPGEARPAVEELLSLYPDFTLRSATKELRKWNFPEEVTRRYLEGLRKAGVPG